MGWLFVLALCAVVGLAYAGWYRSEAQQIKRGLRGAPATGIGAAAEGTAVRITGQVIADGTMEAPLSGRICVCYQLIVEEESSSTDSDGNSTTTWSEVLREVRGVPFIVHDGTGRALIDPTGARITLHQDHDTSSGTFDPASPREEAILARHGQKSSGWVFNRALRYQEGVIVAGETIAAAGHGVREPDPDAVGEASGYREGPPMRFRMSGSAAAPLFLSDRADVM